jgi:hypothetical protein
LKIEDVASNNGQLNIGRKSHPNPGLFFTAALSGCSVFVVGDRRNPSVFHGGSSFQLDHKHLAAGQTVEEFWMSKLGPKPRTTRVRSIGKSDYINQLRRGYQSNDDRLGTTALAQEVEQTLTTQGNCEVTSVSPWGCVFGLRDDGGHWAFELVKNVTMQYWRIKKRLLGTEDRRVGEVRSPQSVGVGIEPETGLLKVKKGHIGTPPTYEKHDKHVWEEQFIGSSKAIAHRTFFPGKGQIVLHDLRSRVLLARQ